MKSKWIVFLLLFIILQEACSRNVPVSPIPPPTGTTPPVKPVDSTQTGDEEKNAYVSGSWECQVDGTPYSGTIDTSFTRIDSSHDRSHPDTVLFCTGSSFDKRANVHFQLLFNRHTISNVPYISTGTGHATFFVDTCSDNILQAFYNSQSEIKFILDSVLANKLQAHFEGTATSFTQNGTTSHVITNGKFTAGFRGGDHDPNRFHYVSDLVNLNGYDAGVVEGYFNEARMISNSLVLDGTPTGWDGQQKFRLIIRTGGTVKPGVYHSEDGNVGLQLYLPSVYRDYVNDSLGSLTVTITSVNGNIVTGNFSGLNQDRSAITSGDFAVRIKDYFPEIDSANKWAFGEDESIFLYRTFAGNVLQGALTQNSGRYYLTISGESDHGSSSFKLMLSSGTPIKKGIYSTGLNPINPSSQKVDSMYFISPEKIWNGNDTYLYSNDREPAFIQIDSIDEHHAEGRMTGVMTIYLSSGGYTSAYIREGTFTTSF